jgi:hypothetical protein
MSTKYSRNPKQKCGFMIETTKPGPLCYFLCLALAAFLVPTSTLLAQDASNEQPLGGVSGTPEENAAHEIPMDVPEPESSNAANDQQHAEDELASIRASKTLHRYSVGSIQKQRMLAEVRKKAIKQGLSGQRLETHMRGAKMIIGSVGQDSMSLELKEGGKLLFNQGERTKVLNYRINGRIVEVDKGDGSFRRFAQFNGNKSTLSLLDPVYGREIVAVLQK